MNQPAEIQAMLEMQEISRRLIELSETVSKVPGFERLHVVVLLFSSVILSASPEVIETYSGHMVTAAGKVSHLLKSTPPD